MICIPKGYYFCSTAAGFKYQGRDDLGFIGSEYPAAAAGVFTGNRFQAAPVRVARALLSDSKRAAGIVINAGQANACTGEEGLADCRRSLELLSETFSLGKEAVLPASTGVIGERMDMCRWEKALEGLFQSRSQSGPLDAAKAIMTTDTFPKLVWRSFWPDEGQEVRLMGLAKGSGMICPNMATMLGFVFCDGLVAPDFLQEVLKAAVDQSFNRITVDGDTSTNDCVLALANGGSGVRIEPKRREELQREFTGLCRELAALIIQDAEGGTKSIRIQVQGAKNRAQAEDAARTVAHSPLVKTALYGRDPNWGRIVAALGRSQAEFDPDRVSISIGERPVFVRGGPINEDLDSLLAPCMARDAIRISLELGAGSADYDILTSDLSVDYVKINADYRS
ncbi:MAG: bifunctional glutamate N-acetyltransferase/amino-acid acetyltransferase ArgJ [Desulfohalobiaceae bacterium]|nr:bifunctional glutamate N-acetyltransferase/amino-acid acetyltransferase ArgJ [Desulfohalobiaceae bacterium]